MQLAIDTADATPLALQQLSKRQREDVEQELTEAIATLDTARERVAQLGQW
jgi:hypothetical protein